MLVKFKAIRLSAIGEDAMKVLLATEWHPLSIGGVQSHVRDLALNLSKLGYEVFIVSRANNNFTLNGQNTNVLRYYTVKSLLPLNVIIVPPDISQLRTLITNIKPDIIHAHHAFTYIPLLSLRVGEVYNIPRVLTNHSIMIGYDYELLWKTSSYFLLPYRYYISKAQVIISVSKAADKFISGFVSGNVKRVIIPNAIDTDRFKPPKKDPITPTILFIGRLVYRKGVHVLLRAFSYVVKEEPQAKLVIAGKGYMKPILRTLALKLNIRGNVKFKGYVPEEEKPTLYKRSSIVAIPSIYGESFGIVALEAIASGRPVVASNIGGLREIIDNGSEGFLVNPNSPKELADKIIMLLQDKKLYKRMTLQARVKAERTYSWDKVIHNIIDVYSQILYSTRG